MSDRTEMPTRWRAEVGNRGALMSYLNIDERVLVHIVEPFRRSRKTRDSASLALSASEARSLGKFLITAADESDRRLSASSSIPREDFDHDNH